MPRDTSINSVLIIGSGPIIIGQACEFDYSGSQAARSLREEGIEVTLLNSNPATIMTDPVVADNVYLMPITIDSIVKILEERKIDAVLPTMGGQTALNLCMEA
jgi:carbamoyl-phosphate synthase large subunit